MKRLLHIVHEATLHVLFNKRRIIGNLMPMFKIPIVFSNAPQSQSSLIQLAQDNEPTPISSINGDIILCPCFSALERTASRDSQCICNEILHETSGRQLVFPVPRSAHITRPLPQSIPPFRLTPFKNSHPRTSLHIIPLCLL